MKTTQIPRLATFTARIGAPVQPPKHNMAYIWRKPVRITQGTLTPQHRKEATARQGHNTSLCKMMGVDHSAVTRAYGSTKIRKEQDMTLRLAKLVNKFS